jgi:hypothetical protein
VQDPEFKYQYCKKQQKSELCYFWMKCSIKVDYILILNGIIEFYYICFDFLSICSIIYLVGHIEITKCNHYEFVCLSFWCISFPSYHLSYASIPFCSGYFEDRVFFFPPILGFPLGLERRHVSHAQLFPWRWVLQMFCPLWPGTVILLISISWVPSITGANHECLTFW